MTTESKHLKRKAVFLMFLSFLAMGTIIALMFLAPIVLILIYCACACVFFAFISYEMALEWLQDKERKHEHEIHYSEHDEEY